MAVTVREAALVPRVLQQAFHLMRSGRPCPVLVDLPFDVQSCEIEFDPICMSRHRYISQPPAAYRRKGAGDADSVRAPGNCRGRRGY